LGGTTSCTPKRQLRTKTFPLVIDFKGGRKKDKGLNIKREREELVTSEHVVTLIEKEKGMGLRTKKRLTKKK